MCQKPCGKRGRREGTKLAFRDFHRCIRVCLFCLPVSRRTSCFHVFEAREVVAPEGEREGERPTNRRCRLKIFWTRKWNLKYFWDFSRCSLFGEISSSTEKFSSLHRSWRGEARRVSSSIFKVSCIHEPFIVEPNNVINLFDLAAVLSRDSTTCWKCYYLLQTITSLPVDNDTKA